MKFYWIPGEHRFVSTQPEAKASGLPWERVEISTAHDDLRNMLNELHAKIAAGGVVPVEGSADAKHAPAPLPKAVAPTYAAQSMTFQEGFETMPLPLKLHYASLALEEARDTIRPLKIVAADA